MVFHWASGGAPKFLLIRNAKGHWDFPKGHVERGETPLAACRREAREEAGLKRLRILPGFRRRLEWRYREGGESHRKSCRFFLAEGGKGRLRLSSEHLRGGWYPLAAALRLLRFPGQRSLLRFAASFLAKCKRRDAIS